MSPIHTERRGGRWRASADGVVAYARSRRKAVALVRGILAKAAAEAAAHRGRHDFAPGTLNAIYLEGAR